MPLPKTIGTGRALLGGGGLLPFSDDFGDGDGPLGAGWSGSTWAIVSGAAVNTPTLGAETFTTANAASDPNGNEADATDGITASNATVTSDADADVGSFALKVESTGASGQGNWSPGISIGNWIALTLSAKRGAVGTAQQITFSNILIFPLSLSAGAYADYAATGLVTNPTEIIRLVAGASGEIGFFDNISVKPITLSTLIASRNAGRADALVSAGVTLQTTNSKLQAGVIANLDSAATPANFVLAFHDGTNARLYKCVAGTWTSVVSAAATYSAGAAIEIRRSGNTYQLFYDDAQVGTDQTISDAGIINNTLYGMFSTSALNSLDDFSLT